MTSLTKRPHGAFPLPGRGPFVSHEQQHAESAEVLVELAHLARDLVGVADNPDIVQHVLDVQIVVGHLRVNLQYLQQAGVLQQREEVAVPIPRDHPFEHVAPGLLGAVGHVDIAGHAPGGAIGSPADPPCALGHCLPVAGENAGRHDVDAHGHPAALAGHEQRLGLGRHSGHGDGRMRLLVRLHVQPQPDLLARLRHRELPELVVVVTGRRVIPQLEHQLDHVGGQAAVLTLFGVHLE